MGDLLTALLASRQMSLGALNAVLDLADKTDIVGLLTCSKRIHLAEYAHCPIRRPVDYDRLPPCSRLDALQPRLEHVIMRACMGVPSRLCARHVRLMQMAWGPGSAPTLVLEDGSLAFPSLRTLTFAATVADDGSSVEALADMLEHKDCLLQDLDLALLLRDFSSGGGRPARVDIPRLFRALGRSETLKRLSVNVQGWRGDEERAAALDAFLNLFAQTKSVEHVVLSAHMWFVPEFGYSLCHDFVHKVLALNKGLTSLHVRPVGDPDAGPFDGPIPHAVLAHPLLERLRLEGPGTDGDSDGTSEWLLGQLVNGDKAAFPKLAELEVVDGMLWNDQLASSLVSYVLDLNALTSLSLTRCTVYGRHVAHLFERMGQGAGRLQHLDLYGTQVLVSCSEDWSETCRSVAGCLRKTTTLKTLILGLVDATTEPWAFYDEVETRPDDALNLVKALLVNKTLTDLDLSYFSIGTNCLDDLCLLLEKNATLRSLDLGNNFLRGSSFQKMRAAIKRNPSSNVVLDERMERSQYNTAFQ